MSNPVITIEDLNQVSSIDQVHKLLLSVGAGNDEKHITIAQLRQLITDLRFRTTYVYNKGDVVIENGELLQANQDGIQGTFDPAQWNSIRLPFEVPGATEYDNSTTYNTGDLVTYQRKLYRAKIDGVQGVAPDSNTTSWEEITYLDGFGDQWVADSYVGDGQVIRHQNLLLQNTVSPYLISRDANKEIDEGKLVALQGGIIYTTIKQNAEIHVPPYSQYTVFGDLTLEDGAVFHIHKNAQVRLVNGNLINNGRLVNNGSLDYITT